MAQFGRDVFLSNMQVGNFQVGEQVSFAMTVNEKGHPQAQDLADSSAVDAGAAPWGSSEDAELASLIHNLSGTTSCESDGMRYVGTVSKFDPAKKYGFIDCPG